MDITQLLYVSELARECNFSRAAENLFITQPALSQQLRKLEAEIGFPLFSRNTKQVKLTPEGQEFIAHTNRILLEYDQLVEFTKRVAHHHKAEITFGTSPSSSKLVLPAIMDFSTKYPDIHLRYIESWDNVLLGMLKEKNLDIAMVLAPKNISIPGIRLVPIFEDRICALIGADDPLSQKEEIFADDLREKQLVFSSPDSVIKQMIVPVLGTPAKRTLDLADKSIRIPMIRSGAVGFSLYKHQLRKQHPDICAIPVKPEIQAMFCFAVSDKAHIAEEQKMFLQIGERVLHESLENGL